MPASDRLVGCWAWAQVGLRTGPLCNLVNGTGIAIKAAVNRQISIEPIPRTFAWLSKNVALNGLAGRLTPLNVALGREQGVARFTSGLDTVNHVVAPGEDAADTVEVPVRTLDSIVGGESPRLVKLDVEGFEAQVLAGAEQTLNKPDLAALIVELNGGGARYGFDDHLLHRKLLAQGFEAFRYHPFSRQLEALNSARRTTGNTLYVRDQQWLNTRLRSAPAFRLGIGRSL